MSWWGNHTSSHFDVIYCQVPTYSSCHPLMRKTNFFELVIRNKKSKPKIPEHFRLSEDATSFTCSICNKNDRSFSEVFLMYYVVLHTTEKETKYMLWKKNLHCPANFKTSWNTPLTQKFVDILFGRIFLVWTLPTFTNKKRKQVLVYYRIHKICWQ